MIYHKDNRPEYLDINDIVEFGTFDGRTYNYVVCDFFLKVRVPFGDDSLNHRIARVLGMSHDQFREFLRGPYGMDCPFGDWPVPTQRGATAHMLLAALTRGVNAIFERLYGPGKPPRPHPFKDSQEHQEEPA